MSNFTGLLSNDLKQIWIDMITEAVRAHSVTCTLIFGDTKFTDCPNCDIDPFTNRSSNRYTTGGPVPFSQGICPYCNGKGKIAETHTESISLAVIRDASKFLPLSTRVNAPKGVIQTVSGIETFDDLRECKQLIVDTSITLQTIQKFERFGEPDPCGFGDSSFVITFWNQIDG